MPCLLFPDLIPLLWGFHLGKLQLLVSGSSSVGSAIAYREAPYGSGFPARLVEERQHQLSALRCPVQGSEFEDC